MNTPIYDKTLIAHWIMNSFQMPPDFEPAPPPTRFDAEFVVAGIEARATVRAGLRHVTGVLR